MTLSISVDVVRLPCGASDEQYWRAILANPDGVLPFSGKVASTGEIAYAHWADKTPHILLSKTVDKADWKNTRIVREVEEIRNIKRQPGKGIYAAGGAKPLRSGKVCLTYSTP